MTTAMLDGVHHIPDSLLDHQRQSWLNGQRPSIEELLEGTPFQDSREAQLDLLYNEVVVQEELGSHPTAEDYIRRYPHLKHDLELQFEIHRAVSEQLLLETADRLDDNSHPDRDADAPAPTLQLNDYDIDRLLGHGGMADVYKARHRRLNRDVALKMFQPSRFLTARETFRIRTEAEAMARLTHPNIVQIFEIGEGDDGAPFLALEPAEQGTLAQKLQQFPYTPTAAAQLIETLARALHHAHERQVIHRDLKPANVLFTGDGVVKITDFGLAKVLWDSEDESPMNATRTGEAMGTPRYMSPEQAAGEHDRVGPATDVYALGTLLYECLTGRAPFVATGIADTLQMIRVDDPLPLRRLSPGIPRDLETIALHCLHKAPERRYPSALALADDLHRFLEGEPIHARPTPGWERLWKWCRRKPAQAALIAAGSFIGFSALAAAIILPQLENRRVTALRNDVTALVNAGRTALDRDEADVAEARFQSAWMIVRGEPALADHETSVTGWLDHSRNLVNRYQWNQRIPPRDYDNRRDEALLLSLLLATHHEHPVPLARRAIRSAMEFTLPNDPAWTLEREQLILLDAEMRSQESGPAQGLALLDTTGALSSRDHSTRRFHLTRAEFLDRLGRSTEASAAREKADRLPRNKTTERFQAGMDLLRERQFEAALGDFEQVLHAEPAHFSARLFQALCCLNLGRHAEAKVALTACIAQRPYFNWSYYYRSAAELAAGDPDAALEDLRRSLEGRPSEAMRHTALAELESFQRDHKQPDRP
jgi:eukaryotic-like serine/threonine-protein kinase